MPAIEVQASDVESAIAQGLSQLNLIRAEVKIEILDEGSRGVLGIGSRPARVRLTPIAELTQPPAENMPAPAEVSEPAQADVPPPSLTASPLPAQTPDDSELPPKIEGEDLAHLLVETLLQRMGIHPSQVTARSVFPADGQEEPYLWVEVTLSNEEEALLLGHQREGLKALQAVAQTMWSHQTKSSARLNVDVNGRRQRREQQLTNMARRLAERCSPAAERSPLNRCRPTNAASCIWPCATTPRCSPRASARANPARCRSSRAAKTPPLRANVGHAA
jgi:spoIIIJ-associated protein